MPEYKIQAPDGKSYRITGPEGASQEDVQREVLRQFPSAGGASPAPAPTASVAEAPESKDIIGRAKEALTKEPPAGSPRDNPVARGIRTAGEWLIPGSIPSAASLAVAPIPGAGALPAVGRAAGAMGLTALAEKAMGRDAGKPAAESGLESLAGSALGGAGRAVYRAGRAAWDKAAPKVAALIEKAVPEFAGKTWQETVDRVMSGEGMKSVGKTYGDRLKALFDKHGDPSDDIGVFVSASPEQRAMLTKRWPVAAKDELAALQSYYAKAMELRKLFGGGKATMPEGREKKLVPGEGSLDIRALQDTFALRKGALKSTLKDDYPALESALFRGETDPLKRDVAGKAPHVSWWGGAIPHVYGMPHAPKLTGEGMTPELTASALRALGARGLGEFADQSAAP